jgi:hypothetical protein
MHGVVGADHRRAPAVILWMSHGAFAISLADGQVVQIDQRCATP